MKVILSTKLNYPNERRLVRSELEGLSVGEKVPFYDGNTIYPGYITKFTQNEKTGEYGAFIQVRSSSSQLDQRTFHRSIKKIKEVMKRYYSSPTYQKHDPKHITLTLDVAVNDRKMKASDILKIIEKSLQNDKRVESYKTK